MARPESTSKGFEFIVPEMVLILLEPATAWSGAGVPDKCELKKWTGAWKFMDQRVLPVRKLLNNTRIVIINYPC